jgi:hypothetical protein
MSAKKMLEWWFATTGRRSQIALVQSFTPHFTLTSRDIFILLLPSMSRAQ